MRRFLVLAACLTACAPATRGGGSEPVDPADPGATPGSPAPAAAGRGAAVLYRPTDPVQYAVVRRDSLELSLPGGASQIQTFDRTAFVRVALAEGPASFRATVVLDSVRPGANSAIPPDSLAHAEGARWTATLSPNGELSDLRADRGGTIVEQVGASLRLLFPTLPPGGARDEAVWTDTTTVRFRADAFDATEHAITEYSAAQNETDGRRALQIEGATKFDRTGTGSQFGNPMEMTATGTRQLTYVLGMDGEIFSVQGSDSTDMTITVPAVGQTVPVKQHGTVSISRVGSTLQSR